MIKYFIIFITMASIFSCSTNKELKTVKSVDIMKYAGVWYEIARLPNSFEKGLDRVSATYIVNGEKKLKVINRGYYVGSEDKYSEVKGVAKIPDPACPGRLKVSFFRPFYADYYIIELDEEYKYALVGTPSRKYLWILSKERTMDMVTYNALIEKAQDNGFHTDNIIRVNQVVDK